jgi:hypothetical protein
MFFISPVGGRKLCLSLSTGFFDAGGAVTLGTCGPVLTAPGIEVWAAANLDTTAGGAHLDDRARSSGLHGWVDGASPDL